MDKIKKVIKILKNEGIKSVYKKIKNRFSKKEKNEYYKWIEKNTPSKNELEKQRKEKFKYNPKISIIVPLYNTPKKYLLELIDYVQKQTYSNWELCLADGSTQPLDFLQERIKDDNRIKYQKLKENKGISGNTNEALKLITGDYVALLDHDDLIPLHSLYEIVKVINENPDVEFIFTDEDKFVDIKKKTRYEPNFKPDYSFDTFTSYNYICHFSIFKRELMDKLQGFKEEFNGSQDYDLILRAVENAKKVIHIPQILYHWRVHPASTASSAEAKPYCFEAGKNAVQEHLKRKGYNQAKMEFGVAIVRNRAVYEIKEKTDVKMYLYLQDERINIEKLKQDISNVTYKNLKIVILTTQHFIDEKEKEQIKLEDIKNVEKVIIVDNDKQIVSKLNELINEDDNSKQIIFAKDIQDIKTNDFIEQLLGFVQRGDVGVVSPRIIHKYTSTQYNGTVYRYDDKKQAYLDYIDVAGSFGYITRGAVVQNYSIIKSECVMVNLSDLKAKGMLDENMNYTQALADLSFDLFKKYQKLNVINPHIELETLEITPDINKTEFYSKWEEELKTSDPNYNVNLKFDKDQIFKVDC